MYILDIFFKRRKFMAIFEENWKVIGQHISLSRGGDGGADPQLELLYFSSIIYSTVYHSALLAGMTTSSAHYLARIQIKKSKIDPSIIAVAQDFFASPDDEKLKKYAARLDESIKPIFAAVKLLNSTAESSELKQLLDGLHQYFRQCEFDVTDLFPAER